MPATIAPQLEGSRKLHIGEIEALSLAVEQQASVLLMDERAGRAVALKLGLRCMGVLGILIEAKTRHLVPKLGPLLDRLEEGACFWISPSLHHQILRIVGEEPG